MLEDFGWSGDEFLIGDCRDDWGMDMLDLRADEYAERQRLLAEDEVDDAWDRENERDLCDIVREHDEEEDWLGENEEDYDCDE
jgi:hypothetical protein